MQVAPSTYYAAKSRPASRRSLTDTTTTRLIERVHADTDRDFVMEAGAALEYGIIDTVITSRQAVDRSGAIR